MFQFILTTILVFLFTLGCQKASPFEVDLEELERIDGAGKPSR